MQIKIQPHPAYYPAPAAAAGTALRSLSLLACSILLPRMDGTMAVTATQTGNSKMGKQLEGSERTAAAADDEDKERPSSPAPPVQSLSCGFLRVLMLPLFYSMRGHLLTLEKRISRDRIWVRMGVRVVIG